MNFNKFEVYGKPQLQQGGWTRTGEGDAYVKYINIGETNYYYRICTLDYVPNHHPTQITITGIASKELEVLMILLRSDNYVISSLDWQENGYTFNLGSTYDKLGVMFRFKNGDAITPNHVSFDIIGDWHSTPHYIHNTSTDTITTLPAVIHPTGTTATVGLKGQMEQSSTPTPTTPVQPSECGERTGNLYFKKLTGANISNEGTITTLTEFDLYIAKVEQGVRYSGNGYIYAFFEDEPVIGSDSFDGSRVVGSFVNIVSPINGFVAVRNPDTAQNAMCNTGSTVLPYEHYGYKIPISSANTTTPVYLGEVETTRRIKKLVLTGEENITFASEDANRIVSVLMIPNMRIKTSEIGYCNILHWKNEYSQSDYNRIVAATSDVFYMSLERSILPEQTIDGFITYLRQQYANGTPVTVWYVLAEPTTGIVNEPIRKIGDYADEVSGISIPTIAGANTISVDTTLQPSEVTVNYKGWHPVADVHEYEGGGTNLFDAEAAYGKMYNDGVVSGTPQNIYAVKNYFTSDEIGKQLTISVYAESVTSNRAEMFVFINGVRTTSNSINRGQQGTMTFTVIPTSTSDNWTITYGSGGDINSFSNLTVTEEPHWD